MLLTYHQAAFMHAGLDYQRLAHILAQSFVSINTRCHFVANARHLAALQNIVWIGISILCGLCIITHVVFAVLLMWSLKCYSCGLCIIIHVVFVLFLM